MYLLRPSRSIYTQARTRSKNTINGVKTIGITNFAKSPLSKNVDIPLYTMSEETDYHSEALASRIAQLAMIDAIYVNVLMAKKEAGKDALQKVRAAISVKRI